MYQVMPLEEQRAHARRMLEIILAVLPPPMFEALQRRVKGVKEHDELGQYRELRQVCQEYQPLAVALADEGYPRLDLTGPYERNPGIGRAVQVFNRVVESWLEEESDEGPPVRHRLTVVPDE